MAAGIYNFTIEQGATFTRIFKYKDANGDPIDLSEATAIRMHIRENIDDTGTITGGSFAMGGSGFTTSIPSGETIKNQITLLIPAVSTSAYTFNQAVYDIELDNQGTTTRLLQGKIKLSKEVTRQ
jgi:hypothetical protein